MLLEHYHTQDWTQSRQQSLCSIFRSILLHPKSLNHYNNVPCLAFKNGVSKLPWRVKKHPLRNPPPHSALSLFFLFVCLCSSSTFKDPERASLRDSGHGDSDQADSDQDTNKGSCCDMSAKEALKLKAAGVKPPPLEEGEPLPEKNVITREIKERRAGQHTWIREKEKKDSIRFLCSAQVICINGWAFDLPERSQSELILGYFISPTLFSALFTFKVHGGVRLYRRVWASVHSIHVLSLSKQTSPLCFYKPNYFSFSI